MRFNFRIKSLAATALLLGSSMSMAIQLSIIPTTTSIEQGDTVSVDLVASDLGNGAAPSLGAFFTEINFDDTVLDFVSVAYGALLGDPNNSLETNIETLDGTGLVSLDEFSFLSNTTLDTLQPDSFTLATLTFSGQGVGTSALTFGTDPGDVDLSDAQGATLTPTALNGSSIDVTPSMAAPSPATATLLLPFALLLLARRRHSAPSA